MLHFSIELHLIAIKIENYIFYIDIKISLQIIKIPYQNQVNYKTANQKFSFTSRNKSSRSSRESKTCIIANLKH